MKDTPRHEPVKPSKPGLFDKLKNYQVFLIFLGTFTVAMAFVFMDVMSPWTVIASPDDAPYYGQQFFVNAVDPLLAGRGTFTPFSLLNGLPQIGFHEMRYVLCMLFFALAGAYYLRTRKVHALPAFGAGLLLCLSGYIFTLFCAGHLGFFVMMGFFFWSFGLLNQALETGRWPYFLLLPTCMMWAQAGQPDVWLLFVAILGAYGLMRLWQVRERFWSLLPKLVVSALLALVIGASGIYTAVTQQLAGRDKQIADSSRSNGAEQKSTPEEKRQQEEDRWIFATNWSLPPADCAELLIPGFFGDNAMTPPYPYWGALGRPYNFEKGKMMPNYRQHTTYLGLVTVLLALIGLCAWVGKRQEEREKRKEEGGKRKEERGGDKTEGQKDARTQEIASTETGADYRDVPFWAGVWVVCLVLALGRYTPLYRLFYAIPYMDYLRAPVKFLHFTELATGLLAGFGLQALLSQRLSRTGLKRLLMAGVGLLVLFGVAWICVSANSAALEKHIAEIGLGQLARALRGYTLYNCLRAMGLLVLVLVLLYAGWWLRSGEGKIRLLLCGLVAIGVFDLAAVARRYVTPINVRAHHEENLLVREMKRVTQGRPALVANYVTRNVSIQDWLNSSFSLNGFPNVLPDETDPNAKTRPVAIALQKDPVRFWEATGTRFLLLPRQQAGQLLQQQLARPVVEVELGQGGVRRSSAATEQAILLLERTRQPIYPCVFFAWTGGVQPEQQAEQLAKAHAAGSQSAPASLVMTDAPAPAGTAEQPAQGVTFSQMRGERNVFVSRATLTLSQPGLLVWNERHSPDLKATLDGQEVPLYQANGQWCAVRVPAGKHTLACGIRVRMGLGFFSMLAGILAFVGASLSFLISRKESNILAEPLRR